MGRAQLTSDGLLLNVLGFGLLALGDDSLHTVRHDFGLFGGYEGMREGADGVGCEGKIDGKLGAWVMSERRKLELKSPIGARRNVIPGHC